MGNSCPLGWPYVLIVFCLFVIFISHFSFKSGIWLFIASVPVHCFSITFVHILRCPWNIFDQIGLHLTEEEIISYLIILANN